MRLTIGRKLNFFLITLLFLSVVGTVITATDLFTTDITGLLKKGSLDATALVAGKVRSELIHLADRAVLLATASFKDFKSQTIQFDFIKEGLGREKDLVSVSLYRREQGQFALVWRILNPKDADANLLGTTEYTQIEREIPSDLESASKGQIGFTQGIFRGSLGLIRVSIPLVQQSVGIFSQFLVIDVKWDRFVSMLRDSAQYAGILVDRDGRILASTHPAQYATGALFGNSVVLQAIERNKGLLGQIDYRDSKGQAIIGSFQKVGFGDLSVIAQIPAADVQRTEELLYRRSAFLGGMFLFLALTVSFQLTRTIVRPIRELSSAAERISEGDFSVRVRVKGKRKGDEVKVLSRTFNTMTEKIGDLLLQQVAKARMEKELETAKALQELYSPNDLFFHKNLNLAGKVIAATECGGDWWHYSELGSHLLVTMGDVTGHGVSAALITASAQGVFSVCLKEMESKVKSGVQFDAEGELKRLARQINTAIIGTGRGQANMTFIASMVNLVSGEIISINCGHVVPFIYRKSASKSYVKLTEVGHLPLGEANELSLSITRLQLKPGDLILWYTDGLIESKGRSGYKFSKSRVLEAMKEFSEMDLMHASSLRDSLLERIDQTAGGGVNHRDDDITLALARVPKNASFSSQDSSDFGKTA